MNRETTQCTLYALFSRTSIISFLIECTNNQLLALSKQQTHTKVCFTHCNTSSIKLMTISSQIKMFIDELWSTIPPAGKMYAMENAWSPSLTRTRTTTTCTAQTARSRSPRISSPCNLLLTAHISNAHSPSNALSTIVTVTFSSRISAKNSLASCS